ncbi:hypothetical protein ACFX1W_029687 [Malus domestica]
MISVRRYCFRMDVLSYSLNSITGTLRPIHYLIQTQIDPVPKIASNGYPGIYERFLLCNYYSTKPPSRSFRRRERKRSESNKSTLDEVQFQRALSQLLPRFTPEELCNVITQQDNPFVCLELFNWASQQPRFKHNVSTYHITIKKLGVAKMYQEMDDVVNQVLAISFIGSEALYNSIIYFFTEARKLTRAVNIFKHMRNSRNMECRPSIRTYNILFTAFLSRGSNSYINHMYMETTRCLFRQMVDDGIEPDIYSLNSMIKGYVLSLHLNDALRIFHQMDVVYKCTPNSFSYDYIIHGLCCQGRTHNAKQLCNEMKSKGFMPSSKSYNSLVNALVLHGEVEEALKYLWEMIENRRSAEFITYKTVLDEICRQGRVGEAMKLLKEFEEKDLLNGHAYRKLLYVLEDDYGDPNAHAQIRPVKKSAQLTLQELSAKHVFTSISSPRTCSSGILLVQNKARGTRRFCAPIGTRAPPCLPQNPQTHWKSETVRTGRRSWNLIHKVSPQPSTTFTKHDLTGHRKLSRMKSQLRENPNNLPPEVIHGILSWLPVKSLRRFECVSKSWCSLISDPQIRHNALHQSDQRQRPSTLPNTKCHVY